MLAYQIYNRLSSFNFFLRENNLIFLKDDARRGKTIFFWFFKQKLVRLKLNGFEKQKSEWIDIWLKYDQNYSTANLSTIAPQFVVH